jgi:UDP-glucose 4-epimerase
LELIERLERAASRKITVNFAEERRGEVNRTWCDISKARRELDFSVPTPLDSGLYTTWRWFEDNREFWPAGAILSSAD